MQAMVHQERAARAGKTLVITHDHCALHMTRKNAPERPMRLGYVMTALRQLQQDEAFSTTLDIQEIKTSEAMLEALAKECCALAQPSFPGALRGPSQLARSMSVGYLEEKIVPAVKAVHTQQYIERLASTCVRLTDQCVRRPKKGAQAELAEIDGDTVVSASSLSAALCAALSCCYAVDACCDVHLPYANAFAVIRPPGHHAGANGPTAGPHRFASVSNQRAGHARPAMAAFEFAEQPAAPCDGMDCSQGFCLLNNAAIAARHALLNHRAAGIGKVAIVDIDLHHGNGTEEIVRGWTDVMYVSLHGVGDHAAGKYFYPDTATELQIDERLVNVPLPQGTTSSAYLEAFDKHVTPNLRRFAPDLILISCGFDACTGDSPAHPQGYLQLDPNAYAELTSRLKLLANECSRGRLVSLFEGGYKPRPLSACARAHVCALVGVDYARMMEAAAERAAAQQAAAKAAAAHKAAQEAARLSSAFAQGTEPPAAGRHKKGAGTPAHESDASAHEERAQECEVEAMVHSLTAPRLPVQEPQTLGQAAHSSMASDPPQPPTAQLPAVPGGGAPGGGPGGGPPGGGPGGVTSLVRSNSRVSRVEQDREVAALMRGTSSLFSGLDEMRIKTATPEVGSSLEVSTSPVAASDDARPQDAPLEPMVISEHDSAGRSLAAEEAASGAAAAAAATSGVAAQHQASSASIIPPEAADLGRRLNVFWQEEKRWFAGTLTRIEAGRDDGLDTGDYHVLYDDGDEQWEPLGTRTQYKWTSARQPPAGKVGQSPLSQSAATAAAKVAKLTKAAINALPLATMPPAVGDIGKRLVVYWPEEKRWFAGALTAIEAGRDDGVDTGDYHVLYDDGDEQWEPLGTRTQYKWTSPAPVKGSNHGPAGGPIGGAPRGHASSPASPSLSSDASSRSGSTGAARPKPKRMLSEKSTLAAMPDAKHGSSRESLEEDSGRATVDADVELS